MRLVIFALVMVLASGVVAQDSRPAEDSGLVESRPQQEAGDEDDTTNYFPVPVRIIESPEEAERTKRREDDADRREQEDLAAQVSMAEATLELVEVSWLQTRLAFAGTILVIGSLCLSAWAALSAVNANKIAREHFAAENRPLILIDDDIDVGWIGGGEQQSDAVVVRVKLHNIGRSPATGVSVEIHMEERNKFAIYSNKGTVRFAEGVSTKGTVSRGNRIVVPGRDPVAASGTSSDIPDTDKTIRLYVCVPYTSVGINGVFYTARAYDIPANWVNGRAGVVEIDRGTSFEKMPAPFAEGTEAMV